MTNPRALAAAWIVISPGQEPCVPVPKAWSIAEPLQELILKNRELIVLFKPGFFASKQEAIIAYKKEKARRELG